MLRSSVSISLCLLLTSAFSEEPPKVLHFSVRNQVSAARELTTIFQVLDLPEGEFTLRDAKGKAMASAYDRAARTLVFQDRFEKGQTRTYAVEPGAAEAVPLPPWNISTQTASTGSDACVAENGLLRVGIPIGGQGGLAMLQIQALKGDYVLQVCPNGVATGCIDDAKYAPQVEALVRAHGQGKADHPQVFDLNFGPPQKVEVLEPNPFQREIRMTCRPSATKGNGEKADVVGESTVSLLLEWGSPVLRIRSMREVTKTFYNHNGFDLNHIGIAAYPVQVQLDRSGKAVPLNADEGGAPRSIGFKKFLWLKQGAGETAVYQPDFEALGIDGARMIASPNWLCTVVSQSWLQGWRPVKIPARRYEDRLVLVCDLGSLPGKKSPEEWLVDLETPLQSKKP